MRGSRKLPSGNALLQNSWQAWTLVIVMIAALIGSVLIAEAMAAEPNSSPKPSLSKAEYETAIADPNDRIGAPETDPEAGENLQHRDLGREAAEELLTGVFGEVIESQSAAPGQEDHITEYDSDHVAVVENPLEGQPALLESLLPLRAKGQDGQVEPVDLELTRGEGELTPQNPLVEVGLPAELGEGIALPASEVEIHLEGAPEERAPSTVAASTAFYPNVAPNTDLAVSPTATGVETLTQIRSAEGPMTETFDLTLPASANLREDEEGGAEVLTEGETLLSIPHPSAMDAEGSTVPVALTVEGHAITLHVDPAEHTVYPILVDPVYETWFWELNHSTEGTSDWVPATNSWMFQPTTVGRYGEPGLNIYTLAGGPIAAGTQANWNYHVPRFYTDQANPAVHEMPTSWIQSMMLTDLRWWFEEPGPPFPADPSLVMGLWDEFHQNWAALGVRTGYEGQLFDQSFRYIFHDSSENAQEEDVHTKTGAIILQSFEGQSHPRHLLVGQAEVQVTDNDYPHFGKVGAPSAWVNNAPTSPIPYEVTDTGLGINELSLWEPTIGGGSKNVLSWEPCFGNVSHPCPRTLTNGQLALNYDPSSMPQGEDWAVFTAQDPLHHWSTLAPNGHWSETMIKVDHTPPEVALAGPLTEQAQLGTHRPSYTLKVNATDGAASAPQSGVVSTEVLVDNKRVLMPDESEWNPNCTTRNCHMAAEWTLNASEFSAGRHEVKVVTRDAVNLSTVKTLSIELHQALPTLNVTGTMTEQSRLGPRRPRYTLKITDSARAESPTLAGPPAYSTAFGSAGSGNGQFNHPADIALDAKGDLWVVDSANNRVEEFNEKGEFLTKFGTAGTGTGQLNRPTAIAVDANGDVWVVDAQNGRVEEFNEKGEFLAEFGSGGKGNGQFSGYGPEGIAIDYHGDIWVSDTSGGRLEKFSEAGQFLRSVGTPGIGSGQLSEPTGIDVGPGGNVWVADYGNNKVLEYGPSGQLLREFGGESTSNGQFRRPDAVAVDSKGDVWVADQNNERVQEFNQGGEYLGKFGAAGSGAGQFNFGFPVGIATDAKGDIWVTDSGNNRIQKWIVPGYATPAGPSYLSSFGTAGTGAGHFSGVDGLAVDAKGNLWATDIGANVVQRLTPGGEVLGVYGGSGTGNGQYNVPTGPSIDSGHVWIADYANNRIQELNESGGFISKIGETGKGNGPYFERPTEVAVDASHHLWVADAANNRVEELTETGSFIRSVSSLGAAGSLNWPAALAVGPGNKIWVTDYYNHRIVELSETGAFLRQFGGNASEPGALSAPIGLAVDSHEDVWVADTVLNRVLEYNGRGEYMGQFGASGSGPGTLNYPRDVALDGKGHLFVSDTENHRVEEWSIPQPHSQVSTEITVDGKRVEATEKGCESETCISATEWTLQSSSVAPGLHQVVVRATDGLGNTTTRTLAVEVQRDETKPSLEVGGELANAPEGWVQQETYGLHATAGDPGGYGVTSVLFKIDGKTVASTSPGCPEGACGATLNELVDMAEYGGGAHEAEVIATDGAGNSTNRRWTINVDPEGHISTTEAEATLEAVDKTAEVNVVGPAQDEGTPADLGVMDGGDQIEVTGSNVPTVISKDPTEGTEVEVAEEAALFNVCDPEVWEATPEGSEESEAEQPEECESPGAPNPEKIGLEPISIVPLTAPGPSEQSVNGNGTATVAANTEANVDSIVRPIFDGVLQFQALRNPSAPEIYSWEVDLEPEQELRKVSDQLAIVYWHGGEHVAFDIEAEPAADAVGTTVPTHLTVSDGNVVTLTVEHHSASYVYPIVAGTGWQGGFQTYEVTMPPPEEPTGGEEGNEEEGGTIMTREGKMEVRLSAVSAGLANSNTNEPPPHLYKVTQCIYPAFPSIEIPDTTPYPIDQSLKNNAQLAPVIGGCMSPGSDGRLLDAVGFYGDFHFENGKRVWVDSDEPIECVKLRGGKGEPGLADHGVQPKTSTTGITARCDFKWPKTIVVPASPVCETLYAHLNASPPHKEVLEPIYHSVGGPGDPCPWPAWPH
ncbi:MAG: hypothetical protein ACRDPE_18755 [Solirubrobacterales bacterium]